MQGLWSDLWEARDAAAVVEIEKLGGKVELDHAFPGAPVASVDLNNRHLDAAALRCLKGLTYIRSLDLRWNQVGDEGVERLKHLTTLESLNLDGTGVSDAGLESLKGLTRLRTLAEGNA